MPSYDPGLFTNGLKRTVWTELSTSPRTPLVNKCIRGQYPPGSTFKMMTAMAALEAGIITPSYRVHCSGSTWIGAAEFHCWKDHGHGRLDLLQALGQSCDVYFYDVARRTGIDTIAAMANRFGLGQVLGVDLPGEQPGHIPTTAWKKQRFGVGWHKGETLVCGIGQGYVNATPLQLAVMAARLATGRKIVPALVHGPATAPPEPLGVSQANLEAVLRGMREVVHGGRGTARQAALDLPGIEVAGKTGTSQVRRMTAPERAMGAERRKKLEVPWIQRDHALFVCFAPYQDPRYAVSVVVEHGSGGAKVAAPIARDIMRKALELFPMAARPRRRPPPATARRRERRSTAAAARARLSLGEKLRQVHWPLATLLLVIGLVGYAMLYSAGGGSHTPWAWKHGVRLAVGLPIMIVIAVLDLRLWFRLSYLFYGAVLAMLAAVDVLGEINKGAQRWLDLGVVQLQPSELMKVALVMALARYFHAAYPEDLRRLTVLVPALLLILVPCGLVLVQPDLGTAVTLLGRGTALLFMAGVQRLEVRGRRRPGWRGAARPLGQSARLPAPARVHLPRPRGRTRWVPATTSSSPRSRWAPADYGARASCAAAKPTSASCPRSTPTLLSPSGRGAGLRRQRHGPGHVPGRDPAGPGSRRARTQPVARLSPQAWCSTCSSTSSSTFPWSPA